MFGFWYVSRSNFSGQLRRFWRPRCDQTPQKGLFSVVFWGRNFRSLQNCAISTSIITWPVVDTSDEASNFLHVLWRQGRNLGCCTFMGLKGDKQKLQCAEIAAQRGVKTPKDKGIFNKNSHRCHTQTLNVWYIYLHLPQNVGADILSIECVGHETRPAALNPQKIGCFFRPGECLNLRKCLLF